MRGHRSGVLGALLAIACIPGVDALPRIEERLRETLMSAILKWTPDLAPEATLELLLADVKATYGVTGHTYESAADALVDLLREWANNGRASIVLRDEVVAGEWRVRMLFAGPGNYQTDLYKRPGERWATYLLPTRAQAWDLAVKEAKERAGRATADVESDESYIARARAAVKPKATTGAAGQDVRSFPLPPRREEDFERGQWMAMNTPLDRAMVTGPVDFKRAGGRSRARRNINAPTAADIHAAERIEASLHPAGRCTCASAGSGDCEWCVMNRRREAREARVVARRGKPADFPNGDAELHEGILQGMRAHERARKSSRRRQRAGQKARRGW